MRVAPPGAVDLRLLAAKAHELFPDDASADLFNATGRASIAPRIVAVVMVLQRYSGMSDREAVDAFAFDARWKYAAGTLDFERAMVTRPPRVASMATKRTSPSTPTRSSSSPPT